MKSLTRSFSIAGVALISLTGLAACESDTAKSSGGSDTTVGKGMGSKDASADVVSVECTGPDVLDMYNAKVTIKNNSSKPSDYFVTIVAESADGSMRYDETMVSVMALAPNQTTIEEGIFTKSLEAGAVCKATEVQRTAS